MKKQSVRIKTVSLPHQFPFAQEANFFPQISIIGTFGEEKESLKR
jgi:hypothetical protein